MITDEGAYICLRSDNCPLQGTAPSPLTGALSGQMKRRTRLVILAVGTVMAALGIGLSVVVYALLSNMCGNHLVAQVASPDSTKTLAVFPRDCGATSGFSTQASILTSNALFPNRNGNVFIADTNHGIAPSGKGGGPELRVQWQNPNLVLLQHHEKARVFKAEPRLGSVEVRYETFR